MKFTSITDFFIISTPSLIQYLQVVQQDQKSLCSPQLDMWKKKRKSKNKQMMHIL